MAGSKINARGSNRAGVSLYLQLSNVFRSRIESGEWAVGARIPTIEELAKEYGVAGMTIRQALGILEDEGLIERFRAKGTFVRAQPTRDLWCDVKTDLSGLLIARPGATITVQKDEADRPLPSGVEVAANGQHTYRHLRRLHTREGSPFLIADVYILDRISHLIKPEDLTSKTAMRMVSDLEGVTIADAKQVLTIERADYLTSQDLDIPFEYPIAKIIRMAFDESGDAIMVAVGSYRSDSVRIEMRLR